MSGRDFRISELRVVTLTHHNNGKRSEYQARHMMHESQVEIFVQATIKLHHSPGYNPHNGVKTDNLWEIKVSKVETEVESYWWCVPDLQNNRDPKGAQLNRETFGERVWAHPKLLEQEGREEQYDD